MFFSVVTKNLNWNILTMKTFKKLKNLTAYYVLVLTPKQNLPQKFIKLWYGEKN